MAAAVARAPHLVDRASTPPPPLALNTTSRGSPTAVPNKHIPTCPTGPRPETRGLETPPDSPANLDGSSHNASLLYPPKDENRISDEPNIYSLTAAELSDALEHMATQALPDSKHVFPWLHGLHPDNQIQQAFFVARKHWLRKTPKCLRSITLVKAAGDLSASKLKGAVGPGELLVPSPYPGSSTDFIEPDPKEGFSVRNFQIQTVKIATVSDIVVYGDAKTKKEDIMRLASRLSKAQKNWRQNNEGGLNENLNVYNTFVVSDPFSTFEENHPELVSLDGSGRLTGNVMDFFYWERLEMMNMSAASEISTNVFLGPTPDPALENVVQEVPDFEVMIETSDMAQIPSNRTLQDLRKQSEHASVSIEFPSSGSIMPPTWSHSEVDGLMSICAWIYAIANPESDISEDESSDHEDHTDADGDSVMTGAHTPPMHPSAKRVLIHCTDGYTESSLLALAYYMYAEGLPVHTAWVQLHKQHGRNFFAYASDVALLNSIQQRILAESPKHRGLNMLSSANAKMMAQKSKTPAWLNKLDGSLPSRILPYMYLGNLNHANNPQMLRQLGITRVLSVGEVVSWGPATGNDKDGSGWSEADLMYIDDVQDNGVDPLTQHFQECLKFIEQGKQDGTATLVHCRVGVSRSATICIAEVMNELGLSFPRAYCFVRARRLNVIIQPHLRFVYELLKWEEFQRQRREMPLRRELEWSTVCREIALMNKPYSRQ